jgi:hypothetical protein
MDRYGILKKTPCGPPEWVGWADRIQEPVAEREGVSGRRRAEYVVRDFVLKRIVASTHDRQN